MSTLLRLGWTNPQTGIFGAHPVRGPVLDLNDGATFTVVTPGGLELPPPPRTLVTAGNIRTQGEQATRAIHRHNRRAVARLIVGPMDSYGDLASAIRLLAAWVSAPPAVPITLQYQPFSATSPVYLDVVGAASDIPADESDWLRLQLEPIELVFVARPGMRGDRVTLQNLVVNPGFEAPMGGGTATVAPIAFADPFAYSVQAGSAPSVAANVMSIPAGTRLGFGSPAWGAINQWTVRFQYATNGVLRCHLHFVDANNSLWVQVFGGTNGFEIAHNVAGVTTALAQTNTALTNGSWYWLVITQFPTVPGDPPDFLASLNFDNAGALGPVISTLGPVPTQSATVAISGAPALEAFNATMNVGGTNAAVHNVRLFGPGGWIAFTTGGTGPASCSWDGANGQSGMSGTGAANTYTGGPVTSFGCARIDFAPAGTSSATWDVYAGGTPAGSNALPVAVAFNTLGASCWVRSNGLGANAELILYLREFDASGGLLRSTAVATKMGNQAGWTQLSGTLATGAGCAYADVAVNALDTSAPGASANATVWLDNAQVWNITTTGQSSMPYCELRFGQSPAQLVVSGLLGDLPAPAHLALGTFVSSLPTGGALSFAVGRRGSTNANAQLVGPSHGWYSPALSPQSTPVLDSNSYGGWYAQAAVTSGWNPRAFSFAPADLLGVYHVLTRFLTQQAPANLGNVEVRATMQQRLQPWYGALDSSDQLNIYYAPFAYPMTASNAWTVVDSGQVAVPAFNAGALADPTQTYLTPHTQWADLTAGGSLCSINWQMLLPVDGSLLTGVLNNPSNAPFAVSGKWLWTYFDGLGANLGIPAAWAYSLESVALSNPAHASGGPGTTGSGAINVNSGADPYLAFDPQLQLAGNGGVNQLAAYVSDGAGSVLPFAADIQYTPLYLYPR